MQNLPRNKKTQRRPLSTQCAPKAQGYQAGNRRTCKVLKIT
jgi:hypothetical protein